MIWIAYLILLFALLRVLISLINLVSQPWLPDIKSENEPFISILVPVRNEEKNIPSLMKNLMEQEYKNYELLVYDDDSGDHTLDILHGFLKNNKKLKIIKGGQLPDGWLGKNHACHQLAKKAKGEYFMFIDADVKLEKDCIHKAINYINHQNAALLTIFPKQVMGTFGEKMVVPLMNWILLSLLPLILVRTRYFSSLSAANGQFMLFERENYLQHFYHEKVKHLPFEDIAIARIMKHNKDRIRVLTGNSDISCRMYHSYFEAIHGFTKNVRAFFGNHWSFLILFTLITSFGPFIIYFNLSFHYFILYGLTILLIRLNVSFLSRQPVLFNILYSIVQHFSFLFVVLLTITKSVNGKLKWKGRIIQS